MKVPVFSFEKLSDANSILGPEMKSTGEVLGLGRTLAEALFKGLTAAGFRTDQLAGAAKGSTGILISVDRTTARKSSPWPSALPIWACRLYATSGTAEAMPILGIPVYSVENATQTEDIPA